MHLKGTQNRLQCRCLYTGQWTHYISYGEKWKVREVLAVAVVSLTVEMLVEMLVPIVYALATVE